MYNFKVVAELKDNLSTEEKINAKELIEYWRKRKGMIQEDEKTFYRVETDNTDLGAATFFAGALSDKKEFFKSILLYNLMDNYSVDVIELEKRIRI